MSNQLLVSVDVEADGPCPGLFSMTEVGAVVVEPGLTRTFYARFRPLEDARYDPEALAVTKRTREECEGFPMVYEGIAAFDVWLATLGARPIFISDNLAFDWAFVNYYFHLVRGHNPFGFSGRRIGDLYAGLKGTTRAGGSEWKKLRKTPHTHHPVDDARGNAEALLAMAEMGLRGIV